MKKVLVPIVVPDWGGLLEMTRRLIQPLEAAGWQTHVVLPGEAEDAAERLHAVGASVVTTPMHRMRRTMHPKPHLQYLYNLRSEVRFLQSYICAQDIDLVQASGLHQLHGVLAARAEHRPLVWQMHSTAIPATVRAAASPAVARLADVVMTSGNAYAAHDRRIRAMGSRWVTFYPPVDTSEFRPDSHRRNEARAAFEIPESSLVLGAVGGRTRVKRHDLVVRASERLQWEGTDIRVLLFGGESAAHADWYEQNVMAPAQQLNNRAASQIVQFGNIHSGLAALLPAIDIFIMPSDAEGAPLALAEAMATGIPSVATSVGSIPEMVRDGHEGSLYRLETFHALSRPSGHSGRIRALEPCSGPRPDSARSSCSALKLCVARHIEAYERALSLINSSP